MEMWGINLLWGKISITFEVGVGIHAGAELGELAEWLRLLGAELLIRKATGTPWELLHVKLSQRAQPDHGVQNNRNCQSWAWDHSFACSIWNQMPSVSWFWSWDERFWTIAQESYLSLPLQQEPSRCPACYLCPQNQITEKAAIKTWVSTKGWANFWIRVLLLIMKLLGRPLFAWLLTTNPLII